MNYDKCTRCGCTMEAHACEDTNQHVELRAQIDALKAQIDERIKLPPAVVSKRRVEELEAALRFYAGLDDDNRVICASRDDQGRRARAVLLAAIPNLFGHSSNRNDSGSKDNP